MSYNAKVRKEQDPDTLTVADGGVIDIESGGKITAAGTQAAHIADAADAAGAAPTAEEYATVVAKLNAVLAALEGVGILAGS
jgi:hypothetical protein